MKHFACFLFVTLCFGLSFGATASAEPEDISDAEIIRWIGNHVPKIARHLAEVKREEPVEYRHELDDWKDFLFHYREVKEDSPSMAEKMVKAQQLEFESMELADKIAEQKAGPERKKLETKLRRKLEKRFSITLAERELELKMLEREISELQKILRRRKELKEQIIERHMGELLGQHDEALDWW